MANSRTASVDFQERRKEQEQAAELARQALRAARRSALDRAAAEYVRDRAADAERRTRALEQRVTELTTVLERGLRRPVGIDLATLRRSVVQPPLDLSAVGWRATPPDRSRYEPEPPTPLRRRLGGGRRHQREVAEARAAYDRDRAEYERREAERQRRFADARHRHRAALAAERRKVAEHNRSVDDFAEALRDRDPAAVCRHLELVLDALPLPAGFPRSASVRWAGSRPGVRVELPHPDVVPTIRAVRYDEAADDLHELPRPAGDAAALYRLLVAEVGLLCLHAAFAADRGLDAVTVTGTVGGTALLRVDAHRQLVGRLDPGDAGAALAELGALLSAHPYALEPIVG